MAEQKSQPTNAPASSPTKYPERKLADFSAVDLARHMAAPGWDGIGIVQGVVIGVKGAQGQYGAYPIVVVARDTNASDIIAIHGFHSALKSAIISARPAPGDRIYCEALDNSHLEAKEGQSLPMLYAVTFTKPNGKANAMNWDMF